jgi:hypothetical protein
MSREMEEFLSSMEPVNSHLFSGEPRRVRKEKKPRAVKPAPPVLCIECGLELVRTWRIHEHCMRARIRRMNEQH